MSDFELLSIVMMILAVIVTLMVELFRIHESSRPSQGIGYFS